MVQPLSQYKGVRLARLSTAQINEHRLVAQRFQQFGTQRQNVSRPTLRETPRPLPLSRLPHTSVIAPAAVGLRAGHDESRILTAHHPISSAAVPHTPIAPHIPTPHSLPSITRSGPRIVTHHNPAPVVHHAPAVPMYHAAPQVFHHAPAAPHYSPPAHHFTPPAHSFAPAAHHYAAPSHGGGHHR